MVNFKSRFRVILRRGCNNWESCVRFLIYLLLSVRRCVLWVVRCVLWVLLLLLCDLLLM